MIKEEPVFVVKPSQWINIGWLSLVPATSLIHPFVGGFFMIIYVCKFIEIHCWKYEFYSDSIVEVKGVFNVDRVFIKYFRIKSVMIEEPFIMRITGLATIKTITSEQFKPSFNFYAVNYSSEITDYLNKLVTYNRKKLGIKERDIFYS